MTVPLVSIVIPCYRQGRQLGGAIDSALAQTRSPVEVVVVNDGSDDDTDAVARSYGERITYLAQPNGGLCSARNAGIRAASGRYLLFLDADDLLHPDAVGWLVDLMDDRDDRLALMGFRFFEGEVPDESEKDLLPRDGAAWFIRLFEIDPLFVARPPGLDRERLALLPYLLYTNFGPPHCWLSPRRRVNEVGMFDEGLRGCADWDLWLRLAMTGADLVTCERAGAFYRRYPGSMSRDDLHMLDDRARVLLGAARGLGARPAELARWGRDLLQAARRVRRRYLALGLRSPVRSEVSRLVRSSQRFETPTARRIWRTAVERLTGSLWDRVALAHYQRARPDVHAYYRSDTD